MSYSVGGMAIGVVFLACIAILYGYMVYRVGGHAKRTGRHWGMHSTATALFGPIYAGLYFLVANDG